MVDGLFTELEQQMVEVPNEGLAVIDCPLDMDIVQGATKPRFGQLGICLNTSLNWFDARVGVTVEVVEADDHPM